MWKAWWSTMYFNFGGSFFIDKTRAFEKNEFLCWDFMTPYPQFKFVVFAVSVIYSVRRCNAESD